MRRILLAFALLASCQITAPGGAGLSGLPDDQISVSSLDAGPPDPVTAEDATPAAGPTEAAPAPEAGAAAAEEPTVAENAEPEATEPETEVPEAAKSAAQVLCEKSGGQWSVAGKSGAFTCIKPTRDAGKTCRKKTDCQGMCLARSGTCAPFMPLFGCNEVLEKDGRRVTLCID